MSNLLVTINLVVLNGEKYIRHCLDGILAQTYPHELIKFNILDNGSTDKTKEIIKLVRSDLDTRSDLNGKLPKFTFVESKVNFGMWPGQEELLKYSSGKYVLAMAVDVILDKDFIKHAVEVMEKDAKIGAIQAKIYKYDLSQLHTTNYILPTTIIDTCGFRMFRSRRLINIGHGEEDKGQYDELGEIFGVEGACPFFRKEALESCRISFTKGIFVYTKMPFVNEIFDHDYFWYGDDLDLAWRMNLFGWRQVFAPPVIAWHDRQTTKKLRRNFKDFLAIRKAIPLRKRRLEWKNIRFTIIKNDYIINILKDLPAVLKREVMMFGYLLVFEPGVLVEVPSFMVLLPEMLRKRREIMKRAVVRPEEMRKWFK